MSKKFIILLISALFIFGIAIVFKAGNIGTSALWSVSRDGTFLLPLVAVAALIDSVNPCAFSVLLLTIAFLFSVGKLRAKIFKIGVAYIVGIFLAYLLIGLGILQALHILDIPHFMGKLGAVLLIVLGAINIINEFYPKFPIKLKIPHAVHGKIAVLMERATVPTAFLLGGLVGLCEFPCTGGPYLLVLGLLHDQATYFRGVLYLLLYNLIFILPLAIILLIVSDSGLLEKVKTWQSERKRAMHLWGGSAMIIFGLLIFLL